MQENTLTPEQREFFRRNRGKVFREHFKGGISKRDVVFFYVLVNNHWGLVYSQTAPVPRVKSIKGLAGLLFDKETHALLPTVHEVSYHAFLAEVLENNKVLMAERERDLDTTRKLVDGCFSELLLQFPKSTSVFKKYIEKYYGK